MALIPSGIIAVYAKDAARNLVYENAGEPETFTLWVFEPVEPVARAYAKSSGAKTAIFEETNGTGLLGKWVNKRVTVYPVNVKGRRC